MRATGNISLFITTAAAAAAAATGRSIRTSDHYCHRRRRHDDSISSCRGCQSFALSVSYSVWRRRGIPRGYPLTSLWQQVRRRHSHMTSAADRLLIAPIDDKQRWTSLLLRQFVPCLIVQLDSNWTAAEPHCRRWVALPFGDCSIDSEHLGKSVAQGVFSSLNEASWPWRTKRYCALYH